MEQRGQTLAEAVRITRMIHIMMLISVFLYVGIGEKFLQRPATIPDNRFVAYISFAALGTAVAGFLFRRRKIAPASEVLQRTPDDPVALGLWRSGNIIGFAVAEAVALFGFALRAMGAALKVSVCFYVAALALMVIWWPKEP